MVDIQWLIGGEAGYGIMTTGGMMSKIFTRLGLSVFDYVEYPSLIRGGHNAYYVRGSETKIHSQKKTVDILVALNRETIDKHIHELSEKAVILYEKDTVKVAENEFPQSITAVPVPFIGITKELDVNKLMMNTVAIGASLAVFHDKYDLLEKILQDAFGKKGEKVVSENVNTSKAGFDYVQKEYPTVALCNISLKHNEQILISGAEALAFGAIQAGIKFAAIYPMTPINSVMTTLVQHALDYNIVVKEPEDEIAGINMAIGASFAGVRSMVATAGGGFALMVEALGMAAQTETPLVIVEGMRPGPSTGLPTWTDQADLRFVLHASQGDFPRIVLCPGDIKECFSFIMHAFNLADKYQLPVIVLVDKYLMEGHASINKDEFESIINEYKIDRGKMLTDSQAREEKDYKRYKFIEDGVSPRSIPGQEGGIALSGSDEHDEKGLYDEEIENRIKMMNKRFTKYENAKEDIKGLDLIGPSDADVSFITFGSTKLPVLDAMQILSRQNISANVLQIHSVDPFPAELVTSFIRDAKNAIIVEANYTGQFQGLVRQHTGLLVDKTIRRFDGRPFYAEELVEDVKKLL